MNHNAGAHGEFGFGFKSMEGWGNGIGIVGWQDALRACWDEARELDGIEESWMVLNIQHRLSHGVRPTRGRPRSADHRIRSISRHSSAHANSYLHAELSHFQTCGIKPSKQQSSMAFSQARSRSRTRIGEVELVFARSE